MPRSVAVKAAAKAVVSMALVDPAEAKAVSPVAKAPAAKAAESTAAAESPAESTAVAAKGEEVDRYDRKSLLIDVGTSASGATI